MIPPDPDDLPVLGEPPAVELANTAYGDGADAVDFLADDGSIAHWFRHASLGLPVAVPMFVGSDADALRSLRDAVRLAFDAVATGAEAAHSTIEAINTCAAAAPSCARLEREPDGRLVLVRVPAGAAPVDAALGWLATGALELLAGPDRLLLRRCGGPGCTMLFVRRHHRRRWCDPSCGHRARQARYYRRRVEMRPGAGR